MEELLTAECYPYFFLDNPEILIKDSRLFSRPRELKRKVRQTSQRIREMIANGIGSQQVIDQSVELITAELRPSRFGYVCALIASEFPRTFLRWVKIDALADQVLDVLSGCEPVFSLLKFNALAAEQHGIYSTVTAFIGHYLKRKRRFDLARPKPAVLTAKDQIQITVPGKPTALTQAVRPAETVEKVETGKAKAVTYYKSELLEKPAAESRAAAVAHVHRPAARRVSQPFKKSEIMSAKQYLINKGINKSIVFKGLKAQYIGYMALGLLIDLLFYAVLYMLKVNTYITLLATALLGAGIAAVVYQLNGRYGEHGLVKALAKRKTPRIVRSFSRRIFR
ncbi:DUF4133 domain-containing protein [Dyadobacter sp. CY312]|uniref:DUF4133 domain-containing protein n=1 Tax=Dyadobacter sp. CY312 TaxID=2907303 RepID=UPI001F316297|nr:DUF4133 domain-containing protein [Dyadobacter sp. CY312]MCE7044064.1 DUF4133 domain-containing protein [Dyadobacter sp. CY312]